MDEGADEELLKQVGNVMHTVLVEFQGCAGRSIFLWGGAGRGKGKNPRGGVKKARKTTDPYIRQKCLVVSF